MSQQINTKVLVIGSGPGGYVAAIRAGQLGLDCVLVESDSLGGTCLARGCIPSKALIQVAEQFHSTKNVIGMNSFGVSVGAAPALDYVKTVQWKDSIVSKLGGGVEALLKRAKVKVIRGWATASDSKAFKVVNEAGEVLVSAEHVILATGSIPIELPMLPFGRKILSSTEMLSLNSIPKSIAVVGAGYIGLELSSAFNRFGAEVSVIEAQSKILPLYDDQLTKPVQTSFELEGIKFYLNCQVIDCEQQADRCRLRMKRVDGKIVEVDSEIVFVAAGRRPLTSGWGLERMTLDMVGPFIKVDERCATSIKNVWAIGDIVGEPMLAHKASAQGEMVAEIIAGRARSFDPAAIPAVCFTDPQIVSVGLSPSEASDIGIDVVIGTFPWSASARAVSAGEGSSKGFLRIVARRDNHQIIGVQAVGGHIAELSGELSLAIEMGAVLEDVAGTIHAHPTLSEALHEASLQALGHPLHI